MWVMKRQESEMSLSAIYEDGDDYKEKYLK